MQIESRDKPGMGGKTAQVAPAPDARLPGATPRGPLQKKPPAPPPLGAFLGVKLTDDLRQALRRRALSEGLSDGAWVRRLMLDALSIESDLDRASAKVPPEELAAATSFMAMLTKLVLASRDLGDGQAASVIEALELQHGRLVKLIERMER